MRFTFSSMIRVLFVGALLAHGAALAFAAPQQGKQDKAPKVPDAERKAAQKIDDAKDAASKMQAANDFIQKYPASSLRPKIVELLIGQIADMQDNAQKISLAESFMGTFMEASEANRMYPILLDAYVSAKRIEDAFNAAKPWLELNPNEVDVLYLLAITGTAEAQRQNQKFVKESQQYGLKAIELIEANKRPEGITVEHWNKNKTRWLPQLYQSMGLIALMNGNNADALTRLQKAVALGPNEPFNYVLLSSIKNEEYTRAATQFQAMPAGSAKTEMEKKLNAQLDELIDLYAHALGLMEGKPQFEQVRGQILTDLTTYYKYRHQDSTNGMQELINKYKQPTP
jgi:tetratricopeptide (TPR) repeat protein